jgi:hypothetical protein
VAATSSTPTFSTGWEILGRPHSSFAAITWIRSRADAKYPELLLRALLTGGPSEMELALI